jgi:hypothetical protein
MCISNRSLQNSQNLLLLDGTMPERRTRYNERNAEAPKSAFKLYLSSLAWLAPLAPLWDGVLTVCEDQVREW